MDRKRRRSSLFWAVPFAVILVLAASIGVVFADHYTASNPPKTVEPVIIPIKNGTWDHSPLTYRVDVNGPVTAASLAQIDVAVTGWNHAIAFAGGPAAFLIEVGAEADADIVIKPKRAGGPIRGTAQCSREGDFFTGCKIDFTGRAFGQDNPDDELLAVVLHELGHALALLHAEGGAKKQDMMNASLQDPAVTRISFCDLDAWSLVMGWLLTTPVSAPAKSSETEATCGEAATGDPPGGSGTLDAVSVSLDRDPPIYAHGDSVLITAHATDAAGDPVEGVIVDIVIDIPQHFDRACIGLVTNSNGDARCRHKVNANRDGTGPYPVTVTATQGEVTVVANTTFTVE